MSTNRSRTLAASRPALSGREPAPGPGRGRRLLAVRLLVPVLVLVVAAVAGCSSGGSKPSVAPTGTSPTATSPSATSPSAAATVAGAASSTPGRAGAPTLAWTSGPMSVAGSMLPPPRLVSVRAAHEVENGATFDQIVLQFTGGVPGYSAQYVRQVIEPGSGAAVPLAGAAYFEIVLHPADAHDDAGRSTVSGTVDTAGLPTVRQVALAGDFEGYVHLAVGLAAVTGYRVSQLTGPDRLVIDFAAAAAGTR